MRRPTHHTRPAFGTPEVLMAIAITGLLLVAALQLVGMVYRNRTAMVERLTGPGLARELMAEIMSMPFDDPDGAGILGIDLSELLANRSTFDDVDDYNGYNAANAENKQRVALSGYTGWRQQAAVAWVTLADPTATAGSDTGVKRITVTITSPSGSQTQLVAYRSRYGALEQNQPIVNTVISQLDAELRTGASARSERSAVAVTNPALDPN
jgi:hypothetical protein